MGRLYRLLEGSPPQFFSEGRALRAAQTNATATVETHCNATHDIYVGTRLDFDCGIVEVRLDGGSPVQLDCYEEAAKARQVRRKVFSNVAAGQHTFEIRLTGTKNAASQTTTDCGLLKQPDNEKPASTYSALSNRNGDTGGCSGYYSAEGGPQW